MFVIKLMTTWIGDWDIMQINKTNAKYSGLVADLGCSIWCLFLFFNVPTSAATLHYYNCCMCLLFSYGMQLMLVLQNLGMNVLFM